LVILIEGKRRRWDWWVCAVFFSGESVYLWWQTFTVSPQWQAREGPIILIAAPMTALAIVTTYRAIMGRWRWRE
jgi:hypothetical protein